MMIVGKCKYAPNVEDHSYNFLKSVDIYLKKSSVRLDSTESGVHILRFSFFFFFPYTWTTSHGFTVQGTKITIHALFINIHTLKNIKMGPTVLFTHLKIILLQYFQFSVFSFSNIKKGKIYWRIKYRFLEVGSTDFWHTCDPGNVGSPGENQER